MAETARSGRPDSRQSLVWRALLTVTGLLAFVLGMGVVNQVRAVDNETTYTGTTVWDSGNVDDNASGAITLPFTFNFYGVNYTQVNITSNGVVNFGASGNAGYSNTDFPTGMLNSVLAFWDDLYITSVNGTSQSAVVYKSIGTAPNREFIAQWTTMYYCCGSATQMGTFQVILYETSNVVQLQYRNIVGTGRSQGNSATIGIQGNSSQYVKFLANVASTSLVDGFAIRYTPNGATYTQTAGATYEPVYVITSTGVESPVLSSPTDAATGVSTTPTLTWSQAANATGYKVYVSTDSQFATQITGSPFTIASGSTLTYTLASALANNTTYYWKVESLRNAITSLSSTRSFTTSAVAKSAQSSLTVVPDSTSISVGGTANLSSTGGSGTGAVTYAVASGTGYCSVSGAVVTGTNAGTCSVTATKASDATYYSATSPAVNIVVSAVVTYSVTYLGNGNTGGSTPAQGSGSSGSTFTVSANSGSLVRTGYTFGGWNTATDGTGTNYTAGSGTFTLAANTTLYAKWTPNTLNVTYDSQGGSSIAAGTTVTAGSIASSPGSPTRSGYVFKGWFAGAAGGSALSFPYAHGQTSDFTIYAQWLTNQSGFALSGAPASLEYLGTSTVTTAGGNGTGAVSYATSSPSVCSVNASSGVVTMLVSSGTCSVTATKAADSTYASATSTVSIAADRANQAALVVSSTAATYGAAYSLATTGGSGTGAVTWQVVLGTCTVSGSTLTPGDAGSTCQVKATKASDPNYFSADSSTTVVSVNRASQATVTVTSTGAMYGAPLSLTATGGSGDGAISWSVVSGTCTVSGSTLTPGNAGSACVVRATKALDTNYNAANSADTTVVIGRTTQAPLVVTSVTAVYGTPYTLATSGGSGSGAVSWSVVSGTCTVSGSTLTPGNAGSTCVVRATKAQDTNYTAVNSSDTSVDTDRANQSALTVTSTSATYGSSYSLTTSGGSGTGSVSWQVMLGTCTVSGSTLTPGDAGSTCQVKATKAQDTNFYSADSANTTVAVNRANQSTLTVTSTNATYGQQLTLAASGGSGTGSISWTKISGTCTVSGSTLTPGDAGSSCVVRATRGLDTNYNAVNSANTSVVTGKANQSGITVTNALSFTTGSALSLTASGGQSSGSLSWAVTGGTCSLTGATLTSARGGVSCTVEVTRAGDSNYNAGSDTSVITVNKITQTLTFRSTPPSPANPGGTYTVNVDSDAFLAPTVAIANGSSGVCTVAAGVVTFNSTGTCLISASQSGNDTIAPAAAAQTVNVVAVAAAAPASTAPAVSVPVAPASSVPAVVTTTTEPQIVKGTAPAVTTTTAPPVATTSTTSTTTTTIPADPGEAQPGAFGGKSELDAGETVAIVQGQKVKVDVKTEGDVITIKLPNDVAIQIGSTDPKVSSAKVSADGVLRIFGGEAVQVSAGGLAPDTTYTVFMFSTPVELGRGVAGKDGKVSSTVRIPKDAKADSHTFQVNGVGPDGEVVTVSMGFDVLKRQDNTRWAIVAISLGILLAMLGGRPVMGGRRRRRA